jgi:hypothetical protein
MVFRLSRPLWELGVGAALVCASIGTTYAAVFTSYSLSLSTGAGPSDLQVTSTPVDLGALAAAFEANASLDVTLTSDADGAAFSKPLASQEALQVIQGCAKAAAFCGDLDWFDLIESGLSLGGNAVSKPGNPPTMAFTFESGQQLVAASVQSLRILIGGELTPNARVAMTGTLDVNPIPEPGTWAMIFAGLVSIVYIARRRLG